MALLVACGLAAAWVRSLHAEFGAEDIFILGDNRYSCWTVQSESGYLKLVAPGGNDHSYAVVRRVSCGTLVPPLTVLSTWLLLSKPRLARKPE